MTDTATRTPPGPVAPLLSGAAPVAVTPPLLIDACECSRLIGICKATWWGLDASARCPAALRVGKRKLWRFSDIQRWCELGLPARAAFEARRDRR